MQQERDAIRDVVLPEIDLLASKYGIVVSIVDLRWGISTEDCESNDDVSLKIFRSCFDEIDESKPFFIGLLGNRYGWVPNLDKNKLDLISNDNKYSKYSGLSITEAEIMYALESFGDNGVFIFGCRKEINGNLTLEDKKIFESIDKQDKERINSLKKKIKSDKRVEYFDYSPKISNGILELDEFSSQLIKIITDKITKDFESRSSLNELDLLKEVQLNKLEFTHRSFSGRENAFESINNFYNSNDVALALTGDSGSGKSMILQEEIYRRREARDNVLFFLLGVGEKSNSKLSLLSSLYFQTCIYLDVKFPKKYFDLSEVENDYDKIVSKFLFNLTLLSKKKRVYLYIDALDQMEGTDSVIDFIHTRYLIENNVDIKIIVTTIKEEEILNELTFRLFNVNNIPKLTQDDIVSITERKLSLEKKTLNKSCMKEIVKKNSNSDSPLYLSLLVQKITNLNYKDFQNIQTLESNLSAEDAIYFYIQSVINGSSSNINGLLFDMIGDAGRKISDRFVYLVLGIISMSRSGIREKDIQGIFTQLNETYSSSDFSYLRKMFRNFITNISSYYDFSHKIIDDALEDYYFNNNKEESIQISKETLNYLDLLSNDDSFKKSEYLFYCYRANDIDRFIKHIQENHSEEDLSYLFDLFSEFENGNDVSEFFSSLEKLDNDLLKTLIQSIGITDASTRKKVCLILLNKKDLSKENKILIYQILAKDERKFGKDKNALVYSSLAFKESVENHLLLNESFELRASLLYDAYKFISLNYFITSGKKHGVDKDIVKVYEDKYDEVRKKQGISSEKFTGFLEDLKKKDLSQLYSNSKRILDSISHFALSNGEEIEQVLVSKNEPNKHYETINELVSYSHLLYLISLVKGFNKKEDAKTFLYEAKNILHPVRDLLETKEDLYLYAKINNQISCIEKNKKDEKDAYTKYIKSNGRDINYSEALAMRYALGMLCGFVIVLCILTLICIGVAKETFYAYIGKDLPSFIYAVGNYSFIGLNFFIWFLIMYSFVTAISNRERYSYLSRLYKKRCLYLLIISIVIETFVFFNSFPLMNAIAVVCFNFVFSILAAFGFVCVVNLIQIAKRKNIEIENRAFFKKNESSISMLVLSFVSLLLAVGASIYLLYPFEKELNILNLVISVIICLICLSGFICQVIAFKIGRKK